MKKACGKPGEIGVGKIHREGLLQGPLQGRAVIEEGTRGKGSSGKEVLQEGKDIVFGDRGVVEREPPTKGSPSHFLLPLRGGAVAREEGVDHRGRARS